MGHYDTATSPVKKQLLFCEGGGARFLNFEAHLVFVLKNVSGFKGTLDFLTQIS